MTVNKANNGLNILLTGGAGFIGVHTLISLIDNGFNPIVLDNLSNSTVSGIKRVEEIKSRSIKFYKGDIRDSSILKEIFSTNEIKGVIHFAGLKAVGESCEDPYLYYDNNVIGTLILIKEMENAGITNLVFSSSATVYGDPLTLPIKEDAQLFPSNPYGQTKLMVEKICFDISNRNYTQYEKKWSIALLRYFNPIGAHESGLIGEDPKDIPNNLMPYISQVASGKLKYLSIYGDDYKTRDGTGVRDYIHIMDLAEGHVAALNWIIRHKDNKPICKAINLGTGKGTSVLELVNLFEKETGISIDHKIKPRRSGDIAECYADPTLAKELLNWESKKTINDMVSDTWKWQRMNPNGYEG